MKLSYIITLRSSLFILLIFAMWGGVFYRLIMREVNDEIDDQLEDYSVMLIQRHLAGEELPSIDNGSNNTYYIYEVDSQYATTTPSTRYSDEMLYIKYKGEEEPARVVKRIFKDSDGQYYELTVATPSIDQDDLTLSILSLLGILYLTLMVTIAIVNWMIIHYSTHPLRKLLERLESLDINERIDDYKVDTSIYEFRKLNSAIESYIQRSKATFELQKEFLGNASHELQTPIAVCQSRLELLVQSELNQEQLSEVEKCLHNLHYLSRLNRSLLLLARIESGTFPSAHISLQTLIEQLLPDYQDVYSYKNIGCKFHARSACWLEINHSLAQTMVRNLLKNAFVHSREGGVIDITLNNNELRITNDGNNAPLDSSKIFTRFNQTRRTKGSTGLGLAITAAICNLYLYSIGYSFDEGRHSFFITFRNH